jgi:hypothetical protein
MILIVNSMCANSQIIHIQGSEILSRAHHFQQMLTNILAFALVRDFRINESRNLPLCPMGWCRKKGKHKITWLNDYWYTCQGNYSMSSLILFLIRNISLLQASMGMVKEFSWISKIINILIKHSHIHDIFWPHP